MCIVQKIVHYFLLFVNSFLIITLNKGRNSIFVFGEIWGKRLFIVLSGHIRKIAEIKKIAKNGLN